MFETWSIANAPGVKSGPALSRYLNHVRNVATTMDSIYVVVALIPCAKLWPWLGEQLNVNSVCGQSRFMFKYASDIF
ncbi:hypothetical protein DPMN_063180 [Dreissena polymorpha]|uniref:Uncharacterized protein n=1 Tax=Dreissena polymorpha TaxID=45954 RepID=A0A9D4CB52_DREPO|nr:hypothetical protein DPMN_063180 [Dreissena polymorpha]